MTKAELIKQAYVSILKPGAELSPCVDANGWIDETDAEKILKGIGDMDVFNRYLRPKVLRGLENNNGFKIVAVDGLPKAKNTTYLVVLKQNPKLAKPMVYSSDAFWLANVTHYKEDCSSLPLY